MELLPPTYCWHCLAYPEWQFTALCWDNTAPFHNAIHDIAVQVSCLLAGLEYKSDRFYSLVNLYGWVEHTTGLPFPLDHYWDGMNAIWFEMGDQFEAEGDADWDKCAVFKFPGFQGGGWPVRWPTY